MFLEIVKKKTIILTVFYVGLKLKNKKVQTSTSHQNEVGSRYALMSRYMNRCSKKTEY